MISFCVPGRILEKIRKPEINGLVVSFHLGVLLVVDPYAIEHLNVFL